jgi:hypothetical protein
VQPVVRLVNQVLPAPSPSEAGPDVTLFAAPGSAEGCASGDCLPSEPVQLQRPGASLPPPSPAEFELEEEAPAPITQVETEHDRWEKAVDAVRTASPRHGKSLSFARFLGFTPEGVKVAFAPDAAFHKAQVTGMSRAIVEAELARALGKPTKLIEDTNAGAFASAKRSIAEVEATDKATRERGIDAKVKDHPAIRSVLKHLGGSIEHVQYLEPVSAPKVALVAPDEPPPGEE